MNSLVISRCLYAPAGTSVHSSRLRHFRRVLGLALVVLLPVAHADARLRRQDQSRLGTVDPRLPRALRSRRPCRPRTPSCPRPGTRGFRPCPARTSRRCPRRRRRPPSRRRARPAPGSPDLLRLLGDGDDDPLLGALQVTLAVDPRRAGLHGPVRMVDRVHEVGRIEVRRLASLREARPVLRAAAGEKRGGRERNECADRRSSVERRAPG